MLGHNVVACYMMLADHLIEGAPADVEVNLADVVVVAVAVDVEEGHSRLHRVDRVGLEVEDSNSARDRSLFAAVAAAGDEEEDIGVGLCCKVSAGFK